MFFKKTNDARPSLARALANAVQMWWRQDDIRASPTEGRLLRIEVPCIIELDGDLFELTRRVIGQRSDGMYVAYDGRAAAGGTECEFECRPGSQTVQWRDASGEREIDSRAIGVFCSKRQPTHEVANTYLR